MQQDPLKRSYQWIVAISAVFFAGYFLLKCPLAFILHREQVSLLQAYSLTTTANILMAAVSIIFGVIFRDIRNQKFMLFLSILISTIALILLKDRNYDALLLGITCYVIGGSLYFFNIIIYINRLLQSPYARQLGNYRYQWWVNVGTFLGGILFVLEYNNKHILDQYSLWACVASLVLFALGYRRILDDPLSLKSIGKILAQLFLMGALVMFCLDFDMETRWLASLAFMAATIYAIRSARKERNRSYYLLILMILFFSVPYWLGYTILYNEFFHLLDSDQHRFFGINSDVIVTLDPLMNVLFGYLVIKWYQKKSFGVKRDLNWGMGLLISAFLVLGFAILGSRSSENLSPIFPIITVILFGCGEFLIQSTLNASVRNLLHKQSSIVFSMGLLRASRAAASALGFFFMWLTVRDGLTTNQMISSKEPRLYFLTGIYILVSLILFWLFKRHQRKKFRHQRLMMPGQAHIKLN